MAYIRYKLGENMHNIVKDVCERLGMKESELSRTALMEYLKSLSVFSDKIKEKVKK